MTYTFFLTELLMIWINSIISDCGWAVEILGIATWSWKQNDNSAKSIAF
jgi:hypothetical protein